MNNRCKINNYDLQNLGKEGVIFPMASDGSVDFRHAVHLNESAMIIWRICENLGPEFLVAEAAQRLSTEFSVDCTVALNDLQDVLGHLNRVSIVKLYGDEKE